MSALVQEFNPPVSSEVDRFVDENKHLLILEVTNVEPILDELLYAEVIQQDDNYKIRAAPSRRVKMQMIFHCLEAAGVRGKDVFYNVLERLEPQLIQKIRSRSSLSKFSLEEDTSSASSEDDHFVDENKHLLIRRVTNVRPILDELLSAGVIQQDDHEKIKAASSRIRKMTMIFDRLEASGVRGKDIFYNILDRLEPRVIQEIRQKRSRSWLKGDDSDKKQQHATSSKKTVNWTEPNLIPSSQTSLHGDWIMLQPDVTNVDSPVYCLESGAGSFECSISGLRWVCKEKMSFKYQFESWGNHMERMETMQYKPAGPLVDITVITGKFDEVYLPHWVCTDDIPDILDKFAVLHIDSCGDVVEKVSEVTPSHVKLSQTVFSPIGALMRFLFPMKINCKVLIYKTTKAFLTLHVYLIPRDPALQQTIENKEVSHGYKIIQKPYPEKSLKMCDSFVLTADNDRAEIYPQKFQLVYEDSDPNFFEVYIKKADSDFKLTLKHEHEAQVVWSCAIREADFQNPGDMQNTYEEELSRVRTRLVEKMSREVINQLLDDLLADHVLNEGERDSVLEENNSTADRGRCLVDTVKKKGREASRKMITHLQRRDRTLCAELGLPSGLPV